MTKNVGGIDRIIRIILGLAIVGWGVFAQSWLGAIGVIFLFTGLVSWCPMYIPMGINTNK